MQLSKAPMFRRLAIVIGVVMTGSLAMAPAEDATKAKELPAQRKSPNFRKAGRAKEPIRTVSAVPDALRVQWQLADFYQQYVDAKGIPILGSKNVSPYALLEAAYLIDHMLSNRDDIRAALIAGKMRVSVMAVSEYTTSVPEHSDYRMTVPKDVELTPQQFTDYRARGLGGTLSRPSTSCGEENLLSVDSDPYAGENILIHEFAHTIHTVGLAAVDRTFDQRLQQAFAQAKAKGLWKNTYALTSHGEYWAEGVQSWFDCNRPKDGAGIHNGIRTREDLKAYDPDLAQLVLEVFGDVPWRYLAPRFRPDLGHLSGLQWNQCPVFAWPFEKRRWDNTSSK